MSEPMTQEEMERRYAAGERPEQLSHEKWTRSPLPETVDGRWFLKYFMSPTCAMCHDIDKRGLDCKDCRLHEEPYFCCKAWDMMAEAFNNEEEYNQNELKAIFVCNRNQIIDRLRSLCRD